MGVMNFAEIMDKGVDIFRKYAKTYIAFIVVFGLISFGCIMGFGMISAVISVIVTLISPSPTTAFILVIGIYMGGIAFVIVSHIGQIKIATQAYFEERVYLGKAVEISFKNIHRVFGILLLAASMFVPAGFIFYYVFKALFKAIEFSMISFGYFKSKEVFLMILFILGIVAVLLAVIAYFTIFAYAFPAVVVEKKGMFGAIKRSFTLIKGNFLRTFGSLIMIFITIYALQLSVQSFIQLVNYLVGLLFSFLNVNGAVTILLTMGMMFIFLPVQLLLGQIIVSMAINMITFLYFNSRFKKEGYDIVLKLKEIQKNQERKQTSEFVSNNNTL